MANFNISGPEGLDFSFLKTTMGMTDATRMAEESGHVLDQAITINQVITIKRCEGYTVILELSTMGVTDAFATTTPTEPTTQQAIDAIAIRHAEAIVLKIIDILDDEDDNF